MEILLAIIAAVLVYKFFIDRQSTKIQLPPCDHEWGEWYNYQNVHQRRMCNKCGIAVQRNITNIDS